MKKTLILILSALMLITAFCSCAHNDPTDQSSGTQSIDPQKRSINDMGIVEVLSLVRKETGITYGYMEITSETCASYFGKGFEFKEALFCEPEMGFGFSLCIARVDSGKVSETAAIVEKNADTMKWVCTGAQTKKVATNGEYVLLIMSKTEECEKVVEAFEAIGK